LRQHIFLRGEKKRKKNIWSWKFLWTVELSTLEADTTHELQIFLHQVRPYKDIEDRHRWLASSNGFFSIKSAYLGLQNRTILDSLNETMVLSIQRLWKTTN
jgi:hypothetical protein